MKRLMWAAVGLGVVASGVAVLGRVGSSQADSSSDGPEIVQVAPHTIG